MADVWKGAYTGWGNATQYINWEKIMGNVTGPIKQAFVDLPQGQIHYRHAGDGPPLLLLHPTSFSSEAYLEIMPILAARFRVIAMDRFGHGGSDPPLRASPSRTWPPQL